MRINENGDKVIEVLDDTLFQLEMDLMDAEEEKDWNKVLSVVEKMKGLQAE